MLCKKCGSKIQYPSLEGYGFCRDCHDIMVIEPLKNRRTSLILLLSKIDNDLGAAEMAKKPLTGSDFFEITCSCGAKFVDKIDFLEHVHARENRNGENRHMKRVEIINGKLYKFAADPKLVGDVPLSAGFPPKKSLQPTVIDINDININDLS
jgi:hypothetical protein